MKKNYKSILALLLCFVLAFGIGGCGSNTENNKQADSNTEADANTDENNTSDDTDNTADADTDDAADADSTNSDNAGGTDLWANAVYTDDTEFGEGNVTVQVEVKVNENDITFTVHSDKSTLGEALLEYSLIAGDNGEYGLYVKEVNGIKADYDTDKAYWAFYKDGEYLNTGVDTTNIADGEHYEIVYTQE